MSDDIATRIYELVATIPRGTVVTYGQIAYLVGLPGRARLVGRTMRNCPAPLALPWHRVIGSRGRGLGVIRIVDPVGAQVQRGLLEGEGVRVSQAGTIRLDEHGIDPRTPFG